MLHDLEKNSNQFSLAIHSTDNSFGFGFRDHKTDLSDDFFVKKFEKDLCNNLIVDFANFITKKNLKKISTIAVTIGPSNFNASRQIVVLARTLSQQINCSLNGFSYFEVMAKRIALKNNICENKKSFWIFKKLRRRGYIAGKYEVNISSGIKKIIILKEKITPQIFEELTNIESSYQAEFNEFEDLQELLNLSNKNLHISNLNTWDKVVPIYPISPIN